MIEERQDDFESLIIDIVKSYIKFEEKKAQNVVKTLKKFGFDRDMVEWIGVHTGVELTDYIQDEFGK